MAPSETGRTRTYYFISDLHIGGDEQLQHAEFEEELLGFLRELEARDEDAKVTED
jgi:UDP-2,3-diacylglucosamine pyrophosphatase LpxH